MNRGDVERDENDPRPFPGPGAKKYGPQYKFNSEELRVLRDCNRESFYKRCLPISAIFGGSVYYGVKTGYLSRHAKYGATPKVIGAVIIGYFMGKFSYQSVCAEKLMQLPNSPMADFLRQKRKGGFQESLDSTFGPSMSLSPFSNIKPSDTYSDVGSPENRLDVDTTRPDLHELDDSYRPSLDNPINEEDDDMPPIQKTTTTYEELRKQNREDYQHRRVTGYRDVIDDSSIRPINKNEPASRKPRTNKYGDTFE